MHGGVGRGGQAPGAWRVKIRNVFAIVLLVLLFIAPVAAEYPVATEPSWSLDSSWDGTTLVPADVRPGEVYWQIRLAYYASDAMDHSLWVYPVDRDTSGVLVDGGVVVVRNDANGYVGQMGTKPPPEWADWPMYRNDTIAFWVEDDLGRRSDVVTGIRQVPKEGMSLPIGVNLYHIGRMFSIQLRRAPEEEPTVIPEPTETPVPTSTPGIWEITEQDGSRIVIELK